MKWVLAFVGQCKQIMCSHVLSFCSLFLLVLLSVGELAGLHRGAGAPWTAGSSPSAQAPHETAAHRTGQSAADRPLQLHMRAPVSSSGLGHHTACRDNAENDTRWSLVGMMSIENATDRLRLFGAFSCGGNKKDELLFLLFWKVLCGGIQCYSQWSYNKYLYEHVWKVSIMNQDYTQKVTS